ncbi:MAG: hypothetical protein ABJP90_19695 [Paracoccaceae bacterium]
MTKLSPMAICFSATSKVWSISLMAANQRLNNQLDGVGHHSKDAYTGEP